MLFTLIAGLLCLSIFSLAIYIFKPEKDDRYNFDLYIDRERLKRLGIDITNYGKK